MNRPRAVARSAAIALSAAVAWSLVAALPVLAAEPTFGTLTINGSLGNGLLIEQPVTLDTAPDRVEVLITFADSPGPVVIEIPPPAPGATTLRHEVVTADGHILPNTPIAVRWRITTDDVAVVGPEKRTLYADERFDWQTLVGDVVRVHWYDGGQAFGERALGIGEQAIKEATDLLGVTEDAPVDFFIYADAPSFRSALGPGTSENVGGQANAEIRTLFALIAPSSINDAWVENVVPHELVHLVFNTAVKNPYHFPPRWLNEGLAVYLAQGYDAGDRGAVDSAARTGDLIPLDALSGQFPTSAQRFAQAYSESVSAIDFLIRTHDQDALITLIKSYADGRTDDQAFEAAIGMDVAAFNDAWLADLGADAPTRHGPQPAPVGAKPPDWATGGSAPGPSGSAAPRPPGGSAPPAPGGPTVPGTAAGESSASLLLVVLAAVVVVGVIVLLLARTRRPRRPESST